ncbi:MAG: DeoR/GlpR family DNA-binding transcription regulator [Phycisphaerae bacterium]
MSATTQQRRESILAEVYERGHVSVKDLASQLAVSEATVRRDLRALARDGKVETVYGGATVPRNSDFSFNAKQVRNVEAKRTIGRLAAELIGDNDQLFLDSGTTCFEVLPYLANRRRLSVIVNSSRLALELDKPGLGAILLGGQYRPDRMDTVGPMAISSLDQLRGYLCFIGTDGISQDFGLTASDIESAALYRLATRNARETILLVDHTKFNRPSLFKIVEFEAVGRVITDQQPDEDWMGYFDRMGIEVIWPGGSSQPDDSAEPARTQN